MVAGNMDHYFYLEKHDRRKKEYPLIKGCRKAWFTLYEINIICPHIKYEVVDYNQGTLVEAPGNEMCEERKEEIMRYTTMVNAINIHEDQ